MDSSRRGSVFDRLVSDSLNRKSQRITKNAKQNELEELQWKETLGYTNRLSAPVTIDRRVSPKKYSKNNTESEQIKPVTVNFHFRSLPKQKMIHLKREDSQDLIRIPKLNNKLKVRNSFEGSSAKSCFRGPITGVDPYPMPALPQRFTMCKPRSSTVMSYDKSAFC